MLSLQLLHLPVLLEHLRLGTPPAPERAPLLASSQDMLCQTFASWASNPASNASSSASLTAGHAPALLAFAAIATLSRDIPNFSGQQSDVFNVLMCICQQGCFVLVLVHRCAASLSKMVSYRTLGLSSCSSMKTSSEIVLSSIQHKQ